ncbi:MAG: redoxin domain-containing protein [Clostridiales bacterium]|nr:redoxin domain-containing protein [Clostridiales bacterium]
MKKRFWITLATILMALLIPTVCVACHGGKEVEYSVTVLSVDEETPVEGVTVSWISNSKTAGSAVTNADGVAKATLPAGIYSVRLSGYPVGYTYTQVRVTDSMPRVILALEVQQQEYTASIVDKTGLPVVGATVAWTDGVTIAGSAMTDESGRAECAIAHGNYYVVLSSLPSGNVCNEILKVTGDDRSVQVNLVDGTAATYRVTVHSEGGLLFKNQTVVVFNGDSDVVAAAKTDEYGVIPFALTAGSYTMRATALQSGYTAQDLSVGASAGESEIVCKSAVIMSDPAANTRYYIGDIIHNYSFVTPYNVGGEPKAYTIAELLKTKKAVVINNWGTKCTYCVQEMPAMEQVYQEYGDDIEILAVSNYNGGDTDQAVSNYREEKGYTFPMMRDRNNFAVKFGITGWPTTIIVDRYGAIARIEEGGVMDVELWKLMIDKFVASDYVQTFTPGEDKSEPIGSEIAKPDFTVPADHYEKMAEAVNDTANFPAGASVEWYGETENEYAWPFLFDKVDGVSEGDEKVLYASNTGKNNSMGILRAKVQMPAGSVLTFDYFASSQAKDILYIYWDGMALREISGDSQGWKTCKVYAELTAGEHNLAMMYRKDETVHVGKDNVFLRNVRFTQVSQLTESTDMVRAAAYGKPAAGATQYPYYAQASIESDTYYHVDTATLQNASYAGNDPKPMLFVNLLQVTNWDAKHSIRDYVYAQDPDTEEYVYDFRFSINGGAKKDYRETFVEYLRTATASDISGFVPVDKELHDLLEAFMKSVNGDKYHANKWLEACYFYSHYGSGDPVGNPIIGLTKKTAIPVAAETQTTAEMTRIMVPFPTTIYSFTPVTSGVYKIESYIPVDPSGEQQYQSQIWLYDDNTDAEHPLIYCGDERFYRGAVNNQNFVVHRYMEAGKKYYLELAFLMAESGTYDFDVTYVGTTASILEPCSLNAFTYNVDENGDPVGEMFLKGAVEYKKDPDGYYHVKNADGTLGSFIYLDVSEPTTLTYVSLSVLSDQYMRDPLDYSNLSYKSFDFRYRIAYYTVQTEDGIAATYYPALDLTQGGEKYKDYTQIFKDYIADPDHQYGDGLVKVNDDMVQILQLLIETRINMLLDNQVEPAFENEWLRFCWYERQYSSTNP